MDLDEIRQILELMREHELSEFELEREGVTLRLRKSTGQAWTCYVPHHADSGSFHNPFAYR